MKGWRNDFVYAWKYFTTPSRPSPSELEYMKKRILEKGTEAKILILGSTPEYRNLCGELGIPVTVIDYNRLSYEVLKELVEHKPKETFIEGNWVDVKLDEKFDVIMGDNVVNVVPLPKIKDFLANMSRILEKNGLFFSRNYVRYNGESYTAEQAMEEYRREGKDWPLVAGTLRNFSMSGYDFKTQMTMLRDIWNGMVRLNKKGLMTNEELETYEKLTLDRDGGFCIPLMEDIEEWYKEFFRIEEVFFGIEPHLKDKLPLHVLELK